MPVYRQARRVGVAKREPSVSEEAERARIPQALKEAHGLVGGPNGAAAPPHLK
jgi:hypothetical protein